MTRITMTGSTLRVPILNWRRELLFVASAGMEAAWLTPFFLTFAPRAQRFPFLSTTLVLAGLIWLFLLLVRLADYYQWEPAQERLLMVLVLPLVILLAWRVYLYPGLDLRDLSWLQAASQGLVTGSSEGHWTVLVTVLFLWWRGLSLSRRAFTFEGVALGFRLGVLLLVVGTLLLSSLTGQQVLSFIFPFFFCSLLAVALARLEEVGQVKGAVGQLLNLYWLAMLMASVLAVLAVGSLLLPLASPQGIETLRDLLAPVGDALAQALIWLLGILLAPLEPLLRWLAELAARGWQQAYDSGLLSNFNRPQFAEQLDQEPLAGRYMATILLVLRLLCGGLILLALVAAGLWILSHQRRQLQEQVEEHESLEVSLRDALLGLLENMRKRLRTAAGMLGRFGVSSELLAAISVRNIYANTTRLARRRGYPRHQAWTPYEYLPILQQAFPGAEAEVRAITDAYVAVHYGEVPATRAEMARLRAAFERLRASPPPTQSSPAGP